MNNEELRRQMVEMLKILDPEWGILRDAYDSALTLAQKGDREAMTMLPDLARRLTEYTASGK